MGEVFFFFLIDLQGTHTFLFQIAEGTIKKPQKKRIETMNMPFYELVMTDGTVCDLNGRPRITRVNYVCYPAGDERERERERERVLWYI